MSSVHDRKGRLSPLGLSQPAGIWHVRVFVVTFESIVCQPNTETEMKEKSKTPLVKTGLWGILWSVRGGYANG